MNSRHPSCGGKAALLALTLLAAPHPAAAAAGDGGAPQVLDAAAWSRLVAEIPLAGPSTRDFARGRGYSAAAGRLRGRDGAPEQHQRSARLLVVREGAGWLRLGGALGAARTRAPGELLGDPATYRGYRAVRLTPGLVVSIPPDTPYQLLAAHDDLRFLMIRIDQPAAAPLQEPPQ